MKAENILTIVAVSAVIICMFGAYWITKKSCNEKYDGFQPQYEVWKGCRIMVDGKLTPVDIVREIN